MPSAITPVDPCLEQEQSPCQRWPPAVATSLTQGPPLPAWQRVPEGQNGMESSRLQPCVPPGHVPAPCAHGHGPALQPSPVAPLFPRVNRTQQARRLLSREGFWLTLAGKQRWRRSAQPPKCGAGGRSAPQAWVEVDPEETPPPREPTCYCRNSQRNSRLG